MNPFPCTLTIYILYVLNHIYCPLRLIKQNKLAMTSYFPQKCLASKGQDVKYLLNNYFNKVTQCSSQQIRKHRGETVGCMRQNWWKKQICGIVIYVYIHFIWHWWYMQKKHLAFLTLHSLCYVDGVSKCSIFFLETQWTNKVNYHYYFKPYSAGKKCPVVFSMTHLSAWMKRDTFTATHNGLFGSLSS